MKTIHYKGIYPKSTMAPKDTVKDIAANAYKSQYGQVVANKNPFDDKQLEKKLKRLDNEQKIRSEDIFWKQRQFFIERAFNENGELKYPKLKKDIASKRGSPRECLTGRRSSTPNLGASNSSPLPSTDSLYSGEKGESFSRAVFPKFVEENRKESQSRFTRRFSMPSHNEKLVRKNLPRRSLPNISDVTEANIVKCNPVVLPVEIDNKINHDKTENKQRNGIRRRFSAGHVKKYEEKRQSDENFESVIEEGASTVHEKETNTHDTTKVSIPTKDNSMKTDVKNAIHKISKDKIINRNKSPSTDRQLDLSEVVGKNKPAELFGRCTVKSTPDELLMKLTRSLPMKLLLKTEALRYDLSDALGFEERRKTFLRREKTVVEQSALNDDRFKNLISSLQRQENHLKFEI